MQIQAKEIQLVDIDSLVLNPKNNNKHPKEQIDRLAKLIQYQGFRNPVVVSKRTGFVLAGHGRIEAAKIAGLKEVPAMFQDFDNEAQEYAYLTSDNAIALWAELDLSAVNTEMLDLGPDFDIDLLGIKDFVIEPIEKFEPQSDEDAVPDVVHPITRKGDIWILGSHRLMCGDSTMIDDVEKLMNGEKADMVFTDPPYGVSFKSNSRKDKETFDVLKNDDVFLDFLPCLEIVTKNDTAWFIWTSQQVYPQWREMFAHYYKSTIIWHKRGGGMGDLKSDYCPDYEMAIYCNKGKPEFIDKRPMAVWEIGKDSPGKYVHPTQKPVELSEYAMSHFVKTEAIVIDLFGGSGSTLIACEKTNRKCYGMELDEKYCDVIIKRWEQYTGKKATLELTGQTYEELKVERDGTSN
jgi:DNA modification methylase